MIMKEFEPEGGVPGPTPLDPPVYLLLEMLIFLQK